MRQSGPLTTPLSYSMVAGISLFLAVFFTGLGSYFYVVSTELIQSKCTIIGVDSSQCTMECSNSRGGPCENTPGVRSSYQATSQSCGTSNTLTSQDNSRECFLSPRHTVGETFDCWVPECWRGVFQDIPDNGVTAGMVFAAAGVLALGSICSACKAFGMRRRLSATLQPAHPAAVAWPS